MKILFLSDRYPPEIGGVAASAARISRSMSRAGHQVDVVAPARELPSGAVDSRAVESSLTIHRYGPARSADYTQQQSLVFLEWLHGQRQFDVVWGHYLTTAGFLAAWFGRQIRRPSIVSVRGNDLDRELFPPGDFGRLVWCLERATRVVTVSRDLADKVRMLVDRDATVLPNAVDGALFAPGPRPNDLALRYGIDPADVVLGFTGELRAKKGLPFLVQCFRELLERQPVRLLVVGQVRGSDRGELDRLLDSDALRERLIVTGHLADPAEVAQHLRLVDVLLIPSIWEGMPNSLLEAMAAGVPVIASDAGAIPEVVTDGVHGLLLPRTHLHLLSQRVEEWLAQPGETRQAIVAAARQLATTYFSPEAEADRLAAILKSLDAGAP